MVVRVEIELEDQEYDDLKEIFDINKKYLSKRALRILGWNRMEVFLADLVRYGVGAASDDPMAFIKEFLDEKLPIFKKDIKETEKKKKRFEEEVKKAYN